MPISLLQLQICSFILLQFLRWPTRCILFYSWIIAAWWMWVWVGNVLAWWLETDYKNSPKTQNRIVRTLWCENNGFFKTPQTFYLFFFFCKCEWVFLFVCMSCLTLVKRYLPWVAGLNAIVWWPSCVVLGTLKVFWGHSFSVALNMRGSGAMIKCRWDVEVRPYVGGCLSGWEFSCKLCRSVCVPQKTGYDEYAPINAMLAVLAPGKKNLSHWDM